MTELNKEVAEAVDKYDFGGVILFAENVKGTAQTLALTQALQQAASITKLIMASCRSCSRLTKKVVLSIAWAVGLLFLATWQLVRRVIQNWLIKQVKLSDGSYRL